MKKPMKILLALMAVSLVLAGIGWLLGRQVRTSAPPQQQSGGLLPTDTPHTKGPTAPPPRQ